MVSRYIHLLNSHRKLSQAATNRLQASLVSMKERHAAMVNALTTQISVLSSQFDQSHANTEKLRLSLDAAGGDVIREALGRRREEFAWSLEKRASMSGFDRGRSVLKKASDEEHAFGEYSRVGRIVVAENAVEPWVEELRSQTARRLELTHSSSSEKISCTSSFRGNKTRPRGGGGIFGIRIPPGPIEDDSHSQPSPRLASQFASIVDELTPSESSSSSSTLITSDPVPFPTKYEPAELKQSTNNDQLLTGRLNDYAEDTRVELEICMALVRGFETVPRTLAGESPTLEEYYWVDVLDLPSLANVMMNPKLRQVHLPDAKGSLRKLRLARVDASLRLFLRFPRKIG
ncbi:hypothetical protein ARMSODRAFT_972664 [Armillaria solidipes]|uniref:Uncharacterized protein n=1 Tax=Armillaria solidipes TaxID=1076256 RepID=A0A2H3BQK4_9AGAR|nr:hypothetical protein ARMSODRAFT_972664 [Armillaria solidipes]